MIYMSFGAFALPLQFLAEIRHSLRYFNLLRTDPFTALTSNAYSGLFFLRYCRQCHQRKKTAA